MLFEYLTYLWFNEAGMQYSILIILARLYGALLMVL